MMVCEAEASEGGERGAEKGIQIRWTRERIVVA